MTNRCAGLLIACAALGASGTAIAQDLAERISGAGAELTQLARYLERATQGELAEVGTLLRGEQNREQLLRNLRALRPAIGRAQARRYLRTSRLPPRQAHRRLRGPLLASIESESELPAPDPAGVSWWVLATIDDAEQDSDAELDAFDADSRSVSLGVERTFGAYQVGLSTAYLDADVDSRRLGDDEIRALQVSLALSRTFGEHVLAANVGYTDSRTDRLRNVPIQTMNGIRAFALTSDIDAEQFAVSLGWSRSVEVSERLSLTPTANLAYSRLTTQDYVERGAGNLGLDVATEDTEQLIASLGLHLSYFTEVGDWLLAPSLSIGVDHDLQSDAISSTSRFRGTDFRFVTDGFAIEETRWRVGLGLQLLTLSGFGVSVALEAQRKDDYSSNVAVIGLQAQL